MKKVFKRMVLFLVPIVMGLSMVLVLSFVGGNTFGASIFESEQDYKLKFVDSTDFLSLSGTSSVILPFDIVYAEDDGKKIKVTTHENAVIFSPLDCEVVSNDSLNQRLELKYNIIKVVITGLISGVKEGTKLQCGEIVGTVDGTTAFVQVYWGEKYLTLQELKAVL